MQALGDTRASVDQMLVGIDRATHLLGQLLTLARTEARSSDEFKTQSVCLADTARQVVGDAAGMAIEREIRLELDDQSDDARVCGDASLLQVLLRNLVDNAIRYSPVDGRVEVSIRRQAQTVTLSVCDTGPGIPVDQREAMFQRFQRGVDVQETGAGLGLSIVNQIARLHHVAISLSEVDGAQGLRANLAFALAMR